MTEPRSSESPGPGDATSSGQLLAGSRTISRFRPHCFEASTITRRSRSSFVTRGSTTERSVTIGTRRSTPSSVAFSTSQSNRSPWGPPWPASLGRASGRSRAERPPRRDRPGPCPSRSPRPGSQTLRRRRAQQGRRRRPADPTQVAGLVAFEPDPANSGGSGQKNRTATCNFPSRQRRKPRG